MRIIRSFIPIGPILALCLLLNCGTNKVVTDPTTGQPPGNQQVLVQVKNVTSVLAIALDEGITLERSLAAQGGVIDPQLEPQLRQWLADGKTSVDAFNGRLAGYTKFDASSKADIMKFADDAVGLISKLNDEGVLRIKNPKSQQVAAGIIAGARVAVVILKSLADKQVAAAPIP